MASKWVSVTFGSVSTSSDSRPVNLVTKPRCWRSCRDTGGLPEPVRLCSRMRSPSSIRSLAISSTCAASEPVSLAALAVETISLAFRPASAASVASSLKGTSFRSRTLLRPERPK